AEFRRRVGSDRSAGHADPTQARAVHRHVPDVEATGGIGRNDGRRQGERARAAGFAEVRGEDREEPAQGWKLEYFGWVGADFGNVDGVAESGDRASERRGQSAGG